MLAIESLTATSLCSPGLSLTSSCTTRRQGWGNCCTTTKSLCSKKANFLGLTLRKHQSKLPRALTRLPFTFIVNTSHAHTRNKPQTWVTTTAGRRLRTSCLARLTACFSLMNLYMRTRNSPAPCSPTHQRNLFCVFLRELSSTARGHELAPSSSTWPPHAGPAYLWPPLAVVRIFAHGRAGEIVPLTRPCSSALRTAHVCMVWGGLNLKHVCASLCATHPSRAVQGQGVGWLRKAWNRRRIRRRRAQGTYAHFHASIPLTPSLAPRTQSSHMPNFRV
jgi:hypothetical protein